MEVNPVNMREAGEIKLAISAFAPGSNGGLIVTAGGAAQRHRDLIVTLPPLKWNGFFASNCKTEVTASHSIAPIGATVAEQRGRFENHFYR
jgi:hypothetical protein